MAQPERLAEAAAATARDWKKHTDAQRELERRTWTPAKAEAVWNTAKARGSDDAKRFQTAAATVRDGSSATDCRSVAADTASTPLAEKGAVRRQGQALAAVACTGRVQLPLGCAHGDDGRQAHTSDAVYHNRWVTLVARAQASLKRYAEASETLSQAPALSQTDG